MLLGNFTALSMAFKPTLNSKDGSELHVATAHMVEVIDHTNGRGGSLYNDVYGGPLRFRVAATLSPCAKDYSKIFESFHASRATSIPVLDLPAVDEEGSEVFFDVQSSSFDYSEAFGGGGGGLYFVVSYVGYLFDLSNSWDFHSSEEDEEAW